MVKFEVEYIEMSELPILAWMARLQLESQALIVFHGSGVETHGGFFVEGVWDGPFSAGDFAHTESFFGSGAVISSDEIVFVSAASTVDSLFYKEYGSCLYISNSLPFLLAGIEETLDALFPDYHVALDSVLKGIHDYDWSIVTTKGNVNRLIFRNLKVSSSGLQILDKPVPGHFDSYETYLEYLNQITRRLHDNIRSRERNVNLELVSTQSRGYDTTAVNALVSEFGIDKVFTCSSSRDKQAFVNAERKGQLSDDGTLIGNALGFQCTPIDRLSFRSFFPDEELFYAGHYNAQDVNLREISHHLDGVSVLLTGVRGEVWYGNEFYSSVESSPDSLSKFDMAGHGLTEIRLHVGIIHVPIPFLGAQRQDDIHAITRSEEMSPWKLNNAYDRPIPRRIAESRGVDRELFGQHKLNTTVAFPKPAFPFNPDLRKEYIKFLNSHGLLRKWQARVIPLVHSINMAIYYHTPKRFRLIYYINRAFSKLLGRRFVMPLLMQRLNSSLYCFCVNRVSERYASDLAGVTEIGDYRSNGVESQK